MDPFAVAKVEKAIEVAWDPHASQAFKAEALGFLNELRSSPQSWRICFSLAVREPRAAEIVRHYCLDTVNHSIQTHQFSEEDYVLLRENTMSYVRQAYGNSGSETETLALQNKIIQTLTFLFMAMYPTAWISYFRDIFSLTSTPGSNYEDNVVGVRFYLRALITVHDEIGDALIPRSSDEQKEVNDLKNLVRQRDVQTIASSWHEILTQWSGRDELVVELALTGIGRWVSWIDISLVLNDDLLRLLFDQLDPRASADTDSKIERKRDVAIATFIEILGKKMPSGDKLKLIDVLKVNEAVSQLINSRSLSDLRTTSDYDTDLAEHVAKLVNNTVSDIIRALDGARDGDDNSQRGTIQLQTFLPYIIRFLSDDYDETCSTVIPCLTDLLTLMRKKMKSNSTFLTENAMVLPLILDTVVSKIRYDETFEWGNEDTRTDEAEFQDLRKRLHVLQQAVAAVSEVVYIQKISDVVIGTFNTYQTQSGRLDWRDVDLAMYEMYLFGEIGLKNGGLYSKTKPASPASERLIEMMFKLVESDIASFAHPAVQLQFMEICVRYYMFFEANPALITNALEKFVQFVHHTHVKVRSRSWYLLQRFVKHLRHHIGNIAETLIRNLGPLLPIKAEVPDDNSDGSEQYNGDASSNENEQTENARFTSQLYLYEAIGCVCSSRSVPVKSQVLYLQSVINPLYADLQIYITQAAAGDKRTELQVHHLIMALGTLARGYSDWTPGNSNARNSTPPPAALSEAFVQPAEAILIGLERLRSSFDVREAARFAFSRLVGVLGNRILPQLPQWIDGLLSQTSTRDEMALFMRLLEQVVFGFKTEIFEILNTLLTPFLQRVFTGMKEDVYGTDDEIQLAELKREYLTFLLGVLNNNLDAVLISQINQPIFGDAISTIELLAKDISDLPTARYSLVLLIRMIASWGGPDVVAQPSSQGSSTPSNKLPSNDLSHNKLEGFDQFMITRFSPLCWALPSNPAFDPKDAQAKQVLLEAAGLQKAIYAKTGQEYLTYLKNVELSGMGMDGAGIEEYLRNLCGTDLRGFQEYFRNLVQRGR